MNPFDDFNRIRMSPWSLPEDITRDFIMTLPAEGLRLSRILPQLAGIDVAPEVTGKEIFVRAAHLARAFDALAEAASNGVVILRGARGNAPAQDIPRSVFSEPLTQVAGDDDAFGPDCDRWASPFLGGLANYNALVWRRVTAERSSTATWISKLHNASKRKTKAVIGISDNEIEEWMRQQISAGKSIHSRTWAKCELRGQGVTRSRFEFIRQKVAPVDKLGRPGKLGRVDELRAVEFSRFPA